MNFQLPNIIDKNLISIITIDIISSFVIIGLGIIINSKILDYAGTGCISITPILLLMNELQKEKSVKQ